MLEYTLKPQISLPPEPSPDDDQASPTDPADSNEDGEDGEDSTADGGSSDGDNTAPADDSASDEADNNEAPVDAEGARRALPNTQDLLKSIKSSNNFSQRVSYMNIAIETVQ